MIRQPIIVVMGHVDHGKCVSGDTVIELGDGKLIAAESVFEKFRQGSPISQPDGVVYGAKNLKLLSTDGTGGVTPKEVSHVWKLTTNRLIHINTRAGYEIKTTPEHRFLILTEIGKLEYVESGKLKIGDSLLIPSKPVSIPASLQDVKRQVFLSLSDVFLIKVSKELNDIIRAYCKKEGIRALGKKIGDISLEYHIRKGFYRPSVLRKILSHTPYYNESHLYDQIDKIKFSSSKRRASHKSFWLKIPHDQAEFEALYYVVGLLFGDGVRGNARLSNTSEVLIEEFRNCLIKSFGIDATCKWHRTSFIVYHKGGLTFAKFLNCAFGYPEIDKSRILVASDVICSAPNGLVSRFLKGFFDAEGFVQRDNNAGNVGLSCESPILMRQLPLLLHRFGCFAFFVKRKKKSAAEIQISGSRNLKAFSENIGFREPRKHEQLKINIEKAVSSRIFESTPINGEFVKEIRKRYSLTNRPDFQFNYYEKKQRLTTYALSKLLSFVPENEEVTPASTLSDYNMIQVSDLKVLDGNFSVYDFTVEDTHNFMANGVIVHNTSLLDRIRNTAVATKEAGGITQHIGASEVPLEAIQKIVGPMLSKTGIKVTIPGLLFIDTPGHEAFTNLRRRGGSVADLAILVVDVTKSFEPQTYEAVEILKEYKTPFIVAANKIDLITGWHATGSASFTDAIEKQNRSVTDSVEARMYDLIGKLSELGFNAERFDRVKDFKKELIIVPISAKTGEGVAELLLYTAGLAQRFLELRLEIEVKGPGRGGILERKEEKGLGSTIDVILYNGTLKVNDTIAFATTTGIGTAKIKALLKPRPLQELRESSSKFYYVDSVSAASGVKISGSGLEDALPGSSVISTEVPGYENEIKSEIKEVFEVDKSGIILKADSIGGIEALSRLLKAANITIGKKGIGGITKRDVMDAFGMRALDPYSAVVMGFNVGIEDEAAEEARVTGVKIIKGNVIYHMIEEQQKWLEEEKNRSHMLLEKALVFPGVVHVLPDHCFRISHPAVFGVDVKRGRIRPGVQLMNKEGEIIGKLKEIQNNNESVQEAKAGESVAVSVDGAVFGRQIRDNDDLYVFLNDEELRALRYKFSEMLSDDEMAILDVVLKIKAKRKEETQ